MEAKIEDITAEAAVKVESSTSYVQPVQKEEKEIKYFQCASCIFKQSYEYFGSNPPQVKNYILLEDAYVIEDPFFPPKQGKIIILGSHCIKCMRSICKDASCSVYFEGTYCIECAKNNIRCFPSAVQEKINRIV